MKDINRIKVVLVEKKRTSKWLSEQLRKDPATISKWCTNTSQPDLVTLTKVAALLDVDVRQLINKTKGTNSDDLQSLVQKRINNEYKSKTIHQMGWR